MCGGRYPFTFETSVYGGRRPITREPTDEDIRINVNMSQIGSGGDDLTFGSAAILYSSVPLNCYSGFDFFSGSGVTSIQNNIMYLFRNYVNFMLLHIFGVDGRA